MARVSTVRGPSTTGVALGASVGPRGHRVHDEAMVVLDQEVAQIRQPRLGTVRFPVQFRVWIGSQRMRIIGTGLTAEALAVPSVLPSFR